jgi:hypothetical protein
MQRNFISTKLFLTLQEASKKGIDMDTKVLRNGYGEFVKYVFLCLILK